MRRFILPAALLPTVVVLTAAPVPKDLETPEKRLERLFGKPVAPDGTKVEIAREVLKITVPELPAGKPGEEGVYASPRTERLVSGDFEFTVSVTVEVPQGAVVDSWAGVYVGFDDKNHFDYMRWLDDRPNRKGGTRGRGVWTQLRTGKGQSNVVGHAEKDVPTATLRIVRKGDELAAHAKYPGDADWSQPVKVSVALPKEVTVGVYVGGRKGPLTAEFRDLTVTPKK